MSQKSPENNYISFTLDPASVGKGYFLTIEALLNSQAYAVTLEELLRFRDLLNDKFPEIKKGYVSLAEHKRRMAEK